MHNVTPEMMEGWPKHIDAAREAVAPWAGDKLELEASYRARLMAIAEWRKENAAH